LVGAKFNAGESIMVTKLSEAAFSKHKSCKSALSITFSGPMLFDFVPDAKSGQVDIYVPFCPYHEAGFFFSSGSLSEIDVWKKEPNTGIGRPTNIAYNICGKGIKPNPKAHLIPSQFPKGPIPMTKTPPESQVQKSAKKRDTSNNVYILQLGTRSGVGAKTTITPPTYKIMFKLTVPMPRYVSPLYFDNLEVLDSFGAKASHTLYQHCTALRFFYEWNARSTIYLETPTTSYEVTPPVFSKLPQMSDIEVRYEGIDVEDENDPHSDARSCFASLATLAGVDWWINYDDGLTSPCNPSVPPDSSSVKTNTSRATRGLVSHTGGDCHAPIIVNGLA
jgi:hypothetical protein